jgi:multicomponent Na+:H+ antiporter subunit B
MSRRARLVVFTLGAVGMAALFVGALAGMPHFGGHKHPYRDAAVHAALRHHTANAVTSVVFDTRGTDTIGEELIFFTSVIAVTALLRPSAAERRRRPEPEPRTVLEATRLIGYVLLPLTLVLGLDVIAHGHLTPGGGFQGGVILATGLHLTYLSGSFRALQRIRPVEPLEISEAAGAAAFVVLGIVAIATSGSFLTNFLSTGTLRSVLSAGTVPVFNGAVGIAVGSGMVVALASFFEQAFVLTDEQVKHAGRSR